MGGGGAGRMGWRFAAFDTALVRRAADFGGGGGVCADVKASISSEGGARTGAPGKSTILLDVGKRAINALAFCEVSFSAARGGYACSSKKALKPSGIVFGEQGGESDIASPFTLDCGLLRGEISSSSPSRFCANGKYGELRSGSSSSFVGGLAGSYSSVCGAGMSTSGQAGCAGSYSCALPTVTGGLEGNSMLSEELCSTKGEELCSSSISVDGRERQNSGIGCWSCTLDSEGLTGLGNDGMLNAEAVDCREFDLLLGDMERLESECSEGKPCSWKAFHADNVGELGVMEARSVWIRRSGAEKAPLGGLSGRWLETKRSLVEISDSSSSPFSSSMPCMILGLVGLLGGGPRICGVSVEMRTQFCLRWPFLAFGLPLRADGFGSG